MPRGLEIFRRQDELGEGEFGSAIRAPLGVHRGARESRGLRFWFYGADYTLTDQLAYLRRIQNCLGSPAREFYRRKDSTR